MERAMPPSILIRVQFSPFVMEGLLYEFLLDSIYNGKLRLIQCFVARYVHDP